MTVQLGRVGSACVAQGGVFKEIIRMGSAARRAWLGIELIH